MPVLNDTASCFFSVTLFPTKLYIYILKGIAFQIASTAGFCLIIVGEKSYSSWERILRSSGRVTGGTLEAGMVTII